jgi:hypothetical protein
MKLIFERINILVRIYEKYKFIIHTDTLLRHAGAKGERRYSSYSFLTSALCGVEWSALRLGFALAPGKGPPVPIVQEAGRIPEPVWT